MHVLEAELLTALSRKGGEARQKSFAGEVQPPKQNSITDQPTIDWIRDETAQKRRRIPYHVAKQLKSNPFSPLFFTHIHAHNPRSRFVP